MTTTRPTPTERLNRPTRYTRFLPSVVALAVLHVGCSIYNGENPCDPETGEIGGWVFYHDGHYIDVDSRPYALPGDRPFDACKIIRGNISFKGEVTDFSDFDHIESIPGFFDNGSILEPAPVEGSSCGILRGFPSLKRITWDLWDTGSNVEDPTICYYLDGFDSLEFVGRDFGCHGSENLGTELIEVGGSLTCPEERLQKLERVGAIRLRGATLPNLRWAGQITTWGNVADPNLLEKVDLPLLEEVGPYFLEGHPFTNEGSLGLVAPTIRFLNLPSLKRVDGPMRVKGIARAYSDLFVEGQAEVVRGIFEDVEFTSWREVCHNDPTDPCPDEPDCAEQYGAESLECCVGPWSDCLDEQEKSENE